MSIKIKQQVDSITGLPNQEGLQTYSSLNVYDDEHVALGSCFISQHLSSSTDTSTTASDWSYDVISRTTFKLNTWFKYHTSGSPYGAISAPAASTNYVTFNCGAASGSPVTHGGIYQKLTGLIVGFDYKVSVRLQNYLTTGGTCNIMTYYLSIDTYQKDIDKSFLITDNPATSLPAMILTAEFTAKTTEDVLLIDFTNSFATGHEPVVEANTMAVQEISVKRKDEYLVPSQATDNNNNYSNLYKLNIQNQNEDGDDPEIPTA
jgi:hypothetical protein|tara:strand:- start:5263 stop:6048 length:786 start_codon:yes stop_codon:yes gene_type:complete